MDYYSTPKGKLALAKMEHKFQKTNNPEQFEDARQRFAVELHTALLKRTPRWGGDHLNIQYVPFEKA